MSESSTAAAHIEFWKSLNKQEYDDFEGKRTLPVYLLTEFCDEDGGYTLNVLGARLGDELSRQINGHPEGVKKVPHRAGSDICLGVMMYYGSFYKPGENVDEDSRETFLFQDAISYLLGLDASDGQGLKDTEGRRSAYRGLLWQQEPPSSRGPSLETSTFAVCVRPRGTTLFDENPQRFWISSLKKLSDNDADVAYALRSEDAFDGYALVEE